MVVVLNHTSMLKVFGAVPVLGELTKPDVDEPLVVIEVSVEFVRAPAVP